MVSNFTIPNPKSQFINPKTGLISRDWYIYLTNLLQAIAAGSTGTTTQVLHGGGLGYSAINLPIDVTGILPGVYGGTGVSNPLKTITLGSNFTLSGSTPLVISVTASSSVVIPISGTLAAISDIGSLGFQDSSNVNINGGTLTSVTVNAVTLITTSTLSLNNLVSTGGTTATFTAVNKPGVSTTTPDTWISVFVDGSIRYIPCWP